jgi:hypothetical protein
MKINRLETHDRLLEFKKQADYISQGAQDCIKNKPGEFENYPFYIFAHKREIGIDERFSIARDCAIPIDQVPTHRMIWIPRLKKPEAQINSILLKHYPKEDVINVIWMIPEPELWDEYLMGKMCENKTVSESIWLFKTDKKKLEADEPDDLSEEKVKEIYRKIGARQKIKPPTWAEFPSASSSPDDIPQNHS